MNAPSDALLRKLQHRRLTTAADEVHQASQALAACIAQLDEGTEAHRQIQAAQMILWPAADIIRRDLAALTKGTLQ